MTGSTSAKRSRSRGSRFFIRGWRNLKQAVSRSADTLVKLTPLLTVAIAVGGFVFSLYQYRGQQREALKHESLDQRIKIQSQLRTDLDQLIQFPNSKDFTLAGAESLLGDIDGLLESKESIAGIELGAVKSDRRRISRVLYDLANLDCNFNEQRGVDFSIVVFDSWNDYQEYLKSDPDLIWDSLLKYTDSLVQLHDTAPRYIGGIKYDRQKSDYLEPEGSTYAETSHLRHFEDLIRGFKRHFDLVSAPDRRAELVKRFQAATCNEPLTKAWFGWSVKPSDDPKWFTNCPKDRTER